MLLCISPIGKSTKQPSFESQPNKAIFAQRACTFLSLMDCFQSVNGNRYPPPIPQKPSPFLALFTLCNIVFGVILIN